VEIPNIRIIGNESRAGTYILRIRLKKDTTLRFGRFKKGKLISLPAGEYAYIGSALAEKGATTLARRLIRHATRSGDQRPHRIRETMLRRFAECGLGDANLLPQRGKTLHWNVDFLLDLPSAELMGISAIRSRKRLEDRLAKQLEEDSHTGVIERGLGANDVPGNTHLLHVNAAEAWWASLSKLLASMAEGSS
jgi:Uri superfamily endonuclease